MNFFIKMVILLNKETTTKILIYCYDNGAVSHFEKYCINFKEIKEAQKLCINDWYIYILFHTKIFPYKTVMKH